MGRNRYRMVWMGVVGGVLMLTWPGSAFGQARRHDRARQERPQKDVAHSDRDAPRRESQGSRPSRFSRPRFYRDGNGYRYGTPEFDDAFQEELDRAYQHGVEDGRQLERHDQQAERGPATYLSAMARGKDAFEHGDYGLAARQFLLATTLDQGDPASRLAAAHALVAAGNFDEAPRLLRRAFGLQPRLAYLPLQIQGAYGNPDHFALHLKALREAAQKDQGNAEIWFLLGYFGYYSNNMADAADALERAGKLLPRDGLIQQLLELARLSVPRTSGGENERGSRHQGDHG